MAERHDGAELGSVKDESPEDKELKDVMDSGRNKEETNNVRPLRKKSVECAQNRKTFCLIKDKIKDKMNIILLGIAIFGIVFSIVGIILKNSYITYDGYEIVKDYTNCTPHESKPDETKCKDYLKATGKECTCYIILEIKELMKAPVTVFYELDNYDQITSRYSQSRDDSQLAGHLSLEPSERCGSHTYACTATGRKPIAPCGRLADAMFNDTFSLHTSVEYVRYFRHGLISEDDKTQFRNPRGNLSQAFSDYSKPMSWRENVWELDPINPDNNGFQNEPFIIWMKTDLKRKPAWRVDHKGVNEKGLPAVNYTLSVKYGYPTSRYDGPRKVIVSSVHQTVNLARYRIGVTLLSIGLSCFILAVTFLLFKNRKSISTGVALFLQR